jgi:phosphopantetheinyl transferase (holo-ACP synthase)
MIVGVGIDICENNRIKEILVKFPDRFLKRVFNDNIVGDYAK